MYHQALAVPRDLGRPNHADLKLRAKLIGVPSNDFERAHRWKWLVEFISYRWQILDSGLLCEAVDEIASEAPFVNEAIRAATATAISSHVLPVELVAFFVAQPLSIAAPVLSRARLRAAEWALVRRSATAPCIRFLETIGGAPELFTTDLRSRLGGTSPSVSQSGDCYERVGDEKSPPSSPDGSADSAMSLFHWPLQRVLDTIAHCRDDVEKALAFPSKRSRGSAPDDNSRNATQAAAEAEIDSLAKQLGRALVDGLERISRLSKELTQSRADAKFEQRAVELEAEAERMRSVVRELAGL